MFICKPIFKIFAAHFRTKGMLNHDKIIFVWGWFTTRWYAKNLLLKDLAYRVVFINQFKIHGTQPIGTLTLIFYSYLSYLRCICFFFPSRERQLDKTPNIVYWASLIMLIGTNTVISSDPVYTMFTASMQAYIFIISAWEHYFSIWCPYLPQRKT